MRSALLSPYLLATLCACGAMGHMPQFPNTAVGRVMAASEPSRYEYKKTVATPIILGNAVSLGASETTVSGITRVYTLRLQDGAVVTITSDGEFQLGNCVELRHGADLSSVTQAANHVNGRLFNSTKC
jgi:hypothetical protein